VHVLLRNGCFCGSTVLAWSKYVTISREATAGRKKKWKRGMETFHLLSHIE
jgi:hypothetical protein